jgi:hypothetical protein
MNDFYNDPEIEAYGFDENAEDCNPEEAQSLAKKTRDIKNETVSFWLKICRGSFMSGTIFDPSTISSEELKRYDNYTGQNKYSYKKVSEECFNHYISYLTTKKTSFLRNAQRGLIS